MSEPPDSPECADDGVSRRDFARLGIVAGGAALLAAGGAGFAAPSIRTISFAGKVVGSVHTPPTTESTSPPISTEGSTVAASTIPPPTDPSSTASSSTSSSSTSSTVKASGDGDATGDTSSDGMLPLTGAAIGGLAIVGGAAVAAGRALASSAKRREPAEDQSFRSSDDD
jgi:hypothetical protein